MTLLPTTSTKNIIKSALIFAVLSTFSANLIAETINLNTADAATLEYIPGVGSSTAQKIIQARTEVGKFTNLDQIDAVRGVGERTMKDVVKYGSLNSGVSKMTEEMQVNRPGRTVSKNIEQTSNTKS